MANADQFPVGTLPKTIIEDLSKESIVPYAKSLDSQKFVLGTGANAAAEIMLNVGTDGFTRALNRASYAHTSAQSTASSITLQVSNFPAPEDSDWYDAGTGAFVHIDYPVKWVRVKATAGEKVYIQSARYLYE